VTVIDLLATAVLIGLILNAVVGWCGPTRRPHSRVSSRRREGWHALHETVA
jgi:hypothetical protein